MLGFTPNVSGLSDAHQDLLTGLWNQIVAKSIRNRLRRQYYDYKNTLKDLGISIPPQLRNTESVLGWIPKGVDALTRRTVLDGFTLDGDLTTADIGLDAVWDRNRMDLEVPQAHTSAAVHSVAFAFVTAGDVTAGEPEALITVKSAEWATGVWDARRRGLSAALSIVSTDERGNPDHMVMYVPGLAVIMRREGQAWDLRQSEHDLGVPVEPLVYRPALDRPFGASRISRAAMAIVDAAVRTSLRTEVSAEFFSAPQRYLLGGDEDAFVDENGNAIPAWQSIIGRIFAIGKDEDGDLPTIGQFQQQSMEPHLAQMRLQASQFASEMNMQPRAFGIMQDNPDSAEAISESKEDLVLDAKHWMRGLSGAWERTARNALRLVDDSAVARAAYSGLRAQWVNPATPSVVSASDAIVKQVAAMPWLADSEVALEMLGYDRRQIDRLMSDKRRARGTGLVNALAEVGRLTGDIPA